MISETVNNIHLPDPADKIVNRFVDHLCSTFQNLIEGVYLTGSIPLQDFYSHKSDIDFLVLCKELPDEKIALQLKRMHRDIEHQYRRPDLSGCYLTMDCIHSVNPEKFRVLSWHEKSMRYQYFEMAPVSLTELKENALTVFGRPASALPVNISREKITGFLSENINIYWTKWITQHSSFFNRKLILLLFPRFTEWSVLGVARQLYTLQTGKITSKTDAGYYCLKHLPEKFNPVIKQAIDIRKDNRTYPLVKSYAIRPSFRRLHQTIECTNYMISLFNEIKRKEDQIL